MEHEAGVGRPGFQGHIAANSLAGIAELSALLRASVSSLLNEGTGLKISEGIFHSDKSA